jgi:hypothetical protein
MDRIFSAAIEDEGWPLGVGVQKPASNCASAAVAQKVTVVSDWRKAGRRGRQVRVEKVNESKPSEDASKELAAVKTAGVSILRDKLGERSADRPSGSRCIGGTSSTQAGKADWRCVGKRQVANTTRRNIDASVSGGATDGSAEGSVMGLEGSGGVVRSKELVNSEARTNQ